MSPSPAQCTIASKAACSRKLVGQFFGGSWSKLPSASYGHLTMSICSIISS